MKIEYWLKDWRDRYIQFPVNPESVEVNSGYEVKRYDVLELGQVSFVDNPTLMEFSIDVLFPKHYNPSYCEYPDIRDPQEYVNIIEEWRSARRNLRFIVAGTPVSVAVYIEDIEYSYERHGEPGDVYATITFVEAKQANVKDDESKSGKRPEKPVQKPKTVLFNQGDTLYAIATKYYGSGDKLNVIYEANKDKFPKGLASKPVGERLRLP